MTRKSLKAETVVVRSASAKPVYDSEDISRINAVIANARPTWFALLGALVFCGITLLGVRDVDFFAANQRTQLPLVNVSVPVNYFFGAGAALVTGLYIYLHLYLELLWAALGMAPARVGSQSLAERILPWQVSEWALRARDKLTDKIGDERSASPRALSVVSSLMSIALVWLFGPVVLAFFWWRSMPAHIELMTIAIGLLFSFALWVGWHSGRQARRLLASQPILSPYPSMISLVPFLLIAFVLSAVSRLGTGGGSWPEGRCYEVSLEDATDILPAFRHAFNCTARDLVVEANLADARLVEQPKDWQSRAEAEREFRALWAQREGLAFRDPFDVIAASNPEVEFQAAWRAFQEGSKNAVTPYSGNVTQMPRDEMSFRRQWSKDRGVPLSVPFLPNPKRNPEREFQKVFLEHRNVYLSTLTKPDLRRRNLRSANLRGAFLPDISLQYAILEGSDLAFATLEAASLGGAQLVNSNLSNTNIEHASAYFVNLSYSIIFRTQFKNANLRGSFLLFTHISESTFEDANLSEVRLFGTPIEPIDLNNSNLKNSNWSFSALRFVRLDRVAINELRWFETSFGDAAVILPADVPRPCQWASFALDDDEYFGRWRGWLEANGVLINDMGFGELDRYTAIPPPPGCGPKPAERNPAD